MIPTKRVQRIGSALLEKRLARKERNPEQWSRRAVTERACELAGKIYGEAAPDIDERWLFDRETCASTICNSDIPKLVVVARVLDLDLNALLLSILR